MILMSPLPQFGPCSTSRSEKRLSSRARLNDCPLQTGPPPVPACGRLQLLRYAGWFLAREHQMRSRVSRGTLDDAKAKLAQIQAGEERFPLAEHDRR